MEITPRTSSRRSGGVQRARERVRAASLHLGRARRPRAPPPRPPAAPAVGRDVAGARAPRRAPARAVAHRDAARSRADAVDRRLHDDAEQRVAVQALAERLADPADGLLQPRALALELVHARLELARHRVELRAERGELVVALRRDLDAEVALAEPLRGVSRRSIWAWSERAAVSANASAQIRNASRISADARGCPPRRRCRPRGSSTQRSSAPPSKPGVSKLVGAVRVPPTSTVAAQRERRARRAPRACRASTCPPARDERRREPVTRADSAYGAGLRRADRTTSPPPAARRSLQSRRRGRRPSRGPPIADGPRRAARARPRDRAAAPRAAVRALLQRRRGPGPDRGEHRVARQARHATAPRARASGVEPSAARCAWLSARVDLAAPRSRARAGCRRPPPRSRAGSPGG